jgi:hypothetical protein
MGKATPDFLHRERPHGRRVGMSSRARINPARSGPPVLGHGPGKSAEAVDKRENDKKLDNALKASFPASDAIAVGPPTATEPPTRPLGRQPAPIDPKLVQRLAREVSKKK